MHRGVLQDCWPVLLVIAVCFAATVAVAKCSGAQWRLRRLRRLHDSQQGGVQSLAFVLTLPIFLMLVLLIVQLSQLMIGLMFVHYAAYAAARSASVWVPTQVLFDSSDFSADYDSQNKLPPVFEPGQPVVVNFPDLPSLGSRKVDEIWTAAALACVPISPSRDLPDSGASSVLGATMIDEALRRAYRTLEPSSASNGRIPARLTNKLAYSFTNTAVRISFEDNNSGRGPTYNPRNHTWADRGPQYEYYPSEVGWQDPVTVTVTHHFALLPGPGRLLAKRIVRADGQPDVISPRINRDAGIYKTLIRASCTATIEGLQSSLPYQYFR